MKIGSEKTDVLCLSWNPRQYTLGIWRNTLQQVEKLKYLGAVFTVDGRRNEEIDARIGKGDEFLRNFYGYVARNS